MTLLATLLWPLAAAFLGWRRAGKSALAAGSGSQA